MLLLIIGDGIQEGVEALTAHLQLHAGLHVGLALLDLSLWRNVDGGLIVVPRVPMRTVLIERGIVRVEDARARIDPPSAALSVVKPAGGGMTKPTTSSAVEFFDHLATKRPELVAPLRAFLADIEAAGIKPEIGRTVKLLYSPTPDTTATAGHIESNGKVWVQGAAASAIRLGQPDAGERYLRTVARMIGGQVRRYEKSAPEVVDTVGRGSDVSVLLAQATEWTAAIATLVHELTPDL